MISVDEALSHIFELATPLETETVPLRAASGRVLAEPLLATRSQPPFRASVMDGYAVAGEAENYSVVGESAAGRGFEGAIGPEEAVRIFTGAPVPENATRVIIQEDVTREGDRIRVAAGADPEPFIREVGTDFVAGFRIDAPRRMSPADITLAASMNAPGIVVARQPRVALIATGDELVMPGESPRPDQIIASNAFGLSAMVESEGGAARMLPICADTAPSLEAALGMAEDADLIVTIGGASVGMHDLVASTALRMGFERAFHKVAIRPGKPMLAGRLNGTAMVGLPGNPVSSMVCGHVFLRPMLRAMQGLEARPLARRTARLSASVDANGPREHYMRAQVTNDLVAPEERQDSSLLTILSGANALIVRPPDSPALDAGDAVAFVEF
ncbi:MAG: molybdopterin molybdotransferase MoeA [Boseongicola sp. SB0677_bin_26]|nr:molybdopterin molybdotransferase MoeA [Boseongicola sp. SB0665_bin_10]MYG24431.1 molybdopterin molybdotransferase MoeA [Boseongicola sp. SB0677_bin_26]